MDQTSTLFNKHFITSKKFLSEKYKKCRWMKNNKVYEGGMLIQMQWCLVLHITWTSYVPDFECWINEKFHSQFDRCFYVRAARNIAQWKLCLLCSLSIISNRKTDSDLEQFRVTMYEAPSHKLMQRLTEAIHTIKFVNNTSARPFSDIILG